MLEYLIMSRILYIVFIFSASVINGAAAWAFPEFEIFIFYAMNGVYFLLVKELYRRNRLESLSFPSIYISIALLILVNLICAMVFVFSSSGLGGASMYIATFFSLYSFSGIMRGGNK